MNMKKKGNWKTYAFWIGLAEAVGFLSGWITREGTQAYKNGDIIKPFLSPPSIVFPIVWTILFALMGWGIARVRLTRPTPAREKATWLFILQLAFNFCWSIYFFNLQAFGVAFVWLVVLWGLILWMTLTFRKVDTLAAKLQIPYLLWVAFAGYLNLGVWLLNR